MRDWYLFLVSFALLQVFVFVKLTFSGENLAPIHLAKSSRFPQVYILDLPSEYNDDLLKVYHRKPFNGSGPFSFKGMGITEPDHPDFLFDTHQDDLDKMFDERIRISSHRTLDPLQADLIYIPFFAARLSHIDQHSRLERLGSVFPEAENSTHWSGISRDKLPVELQGMHRDRFPPLLVMFSMSMTNLCRFPKGGKHLLARPVTKNAIILTRERRDCGDYVIDPAILDVPFPTSVHMPSLSAKMPWDYTGGTRKYLAVFRGSEYMNPNRQSLREILENDPRCVFELASRKKAKRNITASHNIYSQSVFCPHLAGDSWARKGLYDTITNGCIPVLFWGQPKWEMGMRGPRAFLPFADQIDWFSVTVSLPLKSALHHEHLLEMLESIDGSKVREMQRNLARVARKMQYSLFEDDHDAFSMTMDGLSRMLKSSRCKQERRELLVQCFPRDFGLPLSFDTVPNISDPTFLYWKAQVQRVKEERWQFKSSGD